MCKLTSSLGTLRFGIDGDGSYGYYKGDDTFVPFSSGGGINSVTLLNEEYTGKTISYNVEVGKTYIIIAGIRWTSDGNITFSGGDIIFNTSRGALSKDYAWWHTVYTVIIKATSTTITTSYATNNSSQNTYSIYEIN